MREFGEDILKLIGVAFLALVISRLFHLVFCPNSDEYKILIASIFAFLIFFSSSYYTIRTTDKQSMINAYLQAKLSDSARNYSDAAEWFRNGNTWGNALHDRQFLLLSHIWV